MAFWLLGCFALGAIAAIVLICAGAVLDGLALGAIAAIILICAGAVLDGLGMIGDEDDWSDR